MDYSVFSSLIIFSFFILSAASAFWFSMISYREGEKRAGSILLTASFLVLMPGFIAGYYSYPGKGLLAFLLLIFVLSLLFLFVKNPVSFPVTGYVNPRQCVDENDVIFSRMRLIPGTEEWDAYYKAHKTEEKLDNIARALPGLLSGSSVYFNPLTFASADANFELIGFLQKANLQPAADNTSVLSPEALTNYLKGWTSYLGTRSMGICELKDYHLYTVRGRGADWGKPVIRSHRYAIAFTVEMDHLNMQSAPASPVVFESSQKYLDLANIALQISAFLNKSGWQARAHIDGDYELICPLVARDAGLGEIGRMGLLMTPKLGPRVRIAVVTTNAPLITDPVREDPSVTEFCRICRKCADCCPGKCIPHGDAENTDGVLRWRINSDLCYQYWCTCGTDCGRCMSVCPYSHPDNVMHNIVRRLIRRSALMLHLAVVADDFLYGRKPKPRRIPGWMTP